MMGLLQIQRATVLTTALTLAATSVSAFETPEICDRFFAYETLENGDYSRLCGCTAVTKPFLRVIQRSDDFQSVLFETSSQCAALTSLLTDPVTASSPFAPSGDDLRPDGERDTPDRNNDDDGGGGGSSTDDSGGGIYNGW